MSDYGQIVTFDAFSKIRDSLGQIVCTSGGFAPLHPGHATCIIESKQHGDALVAVATNPAASILAHIAHRPLSRW